MPTARADTYALCERGKFVYTRRYQCTCEADEDTIGSIRASVDGVTKYASGS